MEAVEWAATAGRDDRAVLRELRALEEAVHGARRALEEALGADAGDR